jgi:hypothetical protein
MHVVSQSLVQLKLPGLAVHLPMQVAPHEPVHEASAFTLHSPSHSATTVRGVHLAVQPPVTSNVQSADTSVMAGRKPHSDEQGEAIACEETKSTGTATRPRTRRMVLFS